MFGMIVRTQWKWTRTLVLLATVAGFAVPLASLQSASSNSSPRGFVLTMQSFGVAYALLAAGVGLAVALAAWTHDQRGRHIYALSLPVSRARYVLMRLGAGAIFLAPPTVAVLIGALVVSLFGSLPAGLHAYPVALTLRFAFAALVAFAVFFAIGSSTQRTAGIVLGVFAALLLTQYVFSLVGVRYNLLSRVADLLFTAPGLLSVFSGRWTLVDA
jgi:hypothetical protein